MATVRKVGKRQLKILCDCKRKHLITSDDDGEIEIETFNITEDLTTKKEGDKKDGTAPKDTDIFDLLG